jgi:hypothetical protein
LVRHDGWWFVVAFGIDGTCCGSEKQRRRDEWRVGNAGGGGRRSL